MKPQFKNGLFLFSSDLRTQDYPGLQEALNECENIAFVYIFDEALFKPSEFSFELLGSHRHQFLCDSLADLSTQLSKHKLPLVALKGPGYGLLTELVQQHNFDVVYRATPLEKREVMQWERFNDEYAKSLSIKPFTQNRVFDEGELPFMAAYLPDSFSQFRRKVEKLEVQKPRVTDFSKAPKPLVLDERFSKYVVSLNSPSVQKHNVFIGGASAAQDHVSSYLESRAASTYKETRNALTGWSLSTKFSAWLAAGCLSVRSLWYQVKDYEREIEKNKSTEWIFFELLWREYFQWYASAHGSRLFEFSGLKDRGPHLSFYPLRFQLWQTGSTPYPIVNACMRQLNETGYMSNRGRQLVASCFVHELGLDWRYGAAYFQKQLVDYDVGANWGNWQYLAGVGADPRGWRRFNLEKQTQTYDPKGEFIALWGGTENMCELDNVDMADWPIG